MTSNKTIILNGEIIVNPTIECLSTLDLPKEKKAQVTAMVTSETFGDIVEIGVFDYEETWGDAEVEEFINEWILEHEFVEEN